MTSGGRRNRNNRPIEGSGRSDRRAFSLVALPAEGYAGPLPDFPLPGPNERELELWMWLWRTPQACAWSLPSESWRLLTIALYVRTFFKCEGTGSAAMVAQLHRFADQIGMTTAGLAEMGWKVAGDQLNTTDDVTPPTASRGRRVTSRDRIRLVEPLKPTAGRGGPDTDVRKVADSEDRYADT